MMNNETEETAPKFESTLTEEEIAQFFQESAAVLAAQEAERIAKEEAAVLAAQKRAAAILAAKKKALADGIAAGKPIKIEVNCETGEEIVSLLTNEEVSAREVEVARNLAERQVTEAKKAQEEEERQALLAWISSQNSLPQAAKNALARAAGIPLPTESSL